MPSYILCLIKVRYIDVTEVQDFTKFIIVEQI